MTLRRAFPANPSVFLFAARRQWLDAQRAVFRASLAPNFAQRQCIHCRVQYYLHAMWARGYM